MPSFLFSSFIFFIFPFLSFCSISRTYLESNPLLYKNEICSYNGKPIVNSKTSEISCICYSLFTDEPRKKYQTTMFGFPVHCSYQKKRRFLAFFLSCLGPFGFSFLYLGFPIHFFIVIFTFIIVISCHVVFIYLTHQLDVIKEKEKTNNENNNVIYGGGKLKFNVKEYEGIDGNNIRNVIKSKENCLRIFGIVNKCLLMALVGFWIHDIIINAIGKNKDANGVPTENDIQYLFNKVKF